MSWHYRVIRQPDGLLGLHEVYCDDDGRPHSYTTAPVGFVSDAEEGLEGITTALERALRDARERPILGADSFGQGTTP